MSIAIGYAVDGMPEALRRLKLIKQSVANKWLRRGVTKATRVIKAKAKAKVKRDKADAKRAGMLEKSIETKISVKGNKVVGLIGPKKGLKQQIGTRKRDGKKSKAGDPIYYDPQKIAHLVEFGHAGPAPAPAHPFMRPAAEQSKAEVQALIMGELQAGLVAVGRGGK